MWWSMTNANGFAFLRNCFEVKLNYSRCSNRRRILILLVRGKTPTTVPFEYGSGAHSGVTDLGIGS